MLGASSESGKEHCRWASDEVLRHYTKLDRVRRLDATAGVLQSAVVSEGGVSEADSAACLYELLDSGFSQTPAVLEAFFFALFASMFLSLFLQSWVRFG